MERSRELGSAARPIIAPNASGSVLISGSRVALVTHTDQDVLVTVTSSDAEHFDTRTHSCADCDSSNVRKILVVPGRLEDMIASALVFIERRDAQWY